MHKNFMCNEIEYAMIEEYITKLKQKEKEAQESSLAQIAA